MECKVENCRFKSSHTTIYHTCGFCYQKGHGKNECGNGDKMKNLVQYFKDELPISDQCISQTCGNNKKFHTTDTHACVLCNRRHIETHCKLLCKYFELVCPICKTINFISENSKKIYSLTDKCCICLTENVEILMPQCGHIIMCQDCFITQMQPQEDQDELDKYILLAKELFGEKNNKIYCQINGEESENIYFVRRTNKETECEIFIMHIDSWGNNALMDKTTKLKYFLDGYEKMSA